MYRNYFGIYNELMAACVTFLPFIFMFLDDEEESRQLSRLIIFIKDDIDALF